MAKRGKGWSAERRAAQSVRMKSRKPWLKTTGPKTEAGKTCSSLNAYKHGAHSAEIRNLLRTLRKQQEFMERVLEQDRLQVF